MPRRRGFTTVPMVLDRREQWDAEALDAVLRYAGGPKQCWDNTDYNGPWLNVMRNAMNAQIFAFRHPDFLCVSATHGTAQIGLYDDAMWQKYGLAKLAGAASGRNALAEMPPEAVRATAGLDDAAGALSPKANSIPFLQQRGAVFLACHNAAWELAAHLAAEGPNPDGLGADAICAELSNHLAPGVILTPGAVGTLVELERAGFAYAR